MIGRRLSIIIQLYLWCAVAEDTVLFVLAWLIPDLWFGILHGATRSSDLEVTLLRRSAGHWLALAIVHAITLWQWRRKRVWLAASAVARFSDLFTDVSYIIAAPSLTSFGLVVLIVVPGLNLLGVVLLLHGYNRAGSTS
jgi:hypothetical protein